MAKNKRRHKFNKQANKILIYKMKNKSKQQLHQELSKRIKRRKGFICIPDDIKDKVTPLHADELLVLNQHPKKVPYPTKVPLEHYGHVVKSITNQLRYRHMKAMRLGEFKNNNKSPADELIDTEKEIAEFLFLNHGLPKIPYIKKRSKGMRHSGNPVLETAIKLFEDSILNPELWVNSNIIMDRESKRIHHGIKLLNKRVDIGYLVPSLGDKSNKLGIIPQCHNITAMEHFLIQNHFIHIPEDPTTDIVLTLKTYKDNNIKSEFWRQYLEPVEPYTEHYHAGNCYGLFKDHKLKKLLDKEDNNITLKELMKIPIRGICSVNSTSIELTSKWLQYYMNGPQMNSSKYLIIDMQHFQHLLIIHNNDPDINWENDHEDINVMVTDVECMYGSIDRTEANNTNATELDIYFEDIKAMILASWNNNTFIPDGETFKKALILLNDGIIINFNKRYMKQIDGGPMGPPHIPPYSDISFFPWMRRAEQLCQQYLIKNGLKIYRDDNITFWKGLIRHGKIMVNLMNTISKKIKIKLEIDKDLTFGKQAHYLNCTISITPRGIESQHYIKPMKYTNPLPYDYHHPSQIKSIPTTIFHQIRIISDDKFIQKDMERSVFELIDSGHNINTIITAYKKYSICSKMDLLYPSRNKYNLSSIREGYNFINDPYENYINSKINIKNRFSTGKIFNKNDIIENINNINKSLKRQNYFNTDNIQIIIQEHPNLPNMNDIVDQMWNILKLDPEIVGEYGWLKRDMIEIHYKRAPNIREKLKIGHTPKPSTLTSSIQQYYDTYKINYQNFHKLDNNYQPLDIQPLSQQPIVNNHIESSINNNNMDIDEDPEHNLLEPRNTMDMDINESSTDNEKDNNINYDNHPSLIQPIINNTISTDYISYNHYIEAINSIQQNQQLTILQIQHSIISLFWYIKSINTDINNLNHLQFGWNMLEFSIEISKYTKNLSDIRSFCNNNNNNNNKNITNSSNTFSNTFSNTSSN
eukprot:69611_1